MLRLGQPELFCNHDNVLLNTSFKYLLMYCIKFVREIHNLKDITKMNTNLHSENHLRHNLYINTFTQFKLQYGGIPTEPRGYGMK